MLYLIKIFLFLFINSYSFANEINTNQILFKINNKVFTDIDLEKRKEYVALINNLEISEFSKSENKEVLDDYISSLIFYEYYIQNKIFFNNLNNEVELVYKKNSKDYTKLNQTEIKNFRFNISIDLIRNKIIQKELNSKKSSLIQEADKVDLLYNYNLEYIIIKENLIDKELIGNIDNKEKLEKLKIFLKKNKINFFNKEEDINDNSKISNKIKKLINQNIKIFNSIENGYINIISIHKNLESYEGVFVKLINFKSNKPFKREELECNKLNEEIDIGKIVFKEYEYSKLNDEIKNNLKAIDDYIFFKENDEYNYIVLCDLRYDEKLLKNINFNKNVNSLVNKIQKNFLIKYKNEYKYKKIK